MRAQSRDLIFFKPQRITILILLSLIPAFGYAHTGVGETAGLLHGFYHPLLGLDHLLAMIAVGIWATQLNGKTAVWMIPTTFVSVMLLGSLLGLMGIAIPFIEQGILLSVLLLGLLITVAWQLPSALSISLVGLFALFHGHAHGTEMPLAVSGLVYAAGFALTTAMLHIAGMGIGFSLKRVREELVRLSGIAIILSGTYLAFS